MTPQEIETIADKLRAISEDIRYDAPLRHGFDHSQKAALRYDLDEVAEKLDYIALNLTLLYEGAVVDYPSFADLHPEPKR